jgi:dsDNA-specific endonuclease/ATPase MutS2
MKQYKRTILLSKNERGIWDLDTIKGCKSGLNETIGGCYGDCYAYKTAKRYGIDFSISTERYFENENHRQSIVRKIEKIDMPFIRIGCSGDPSENWEHTISIINQIRNTNQLSLFDISSKKQIVIITRHWNILKEDQLHEIAKYNICINTSVSALDKSSLIEKALSQYNRLKPFCKSILRVVTADFNEQNAKGRQMAEMQRKLLNEKNVIDTVFRPSSKNKYVTDGIVNVKKMSFMKSKALVSKYNKKTFLGKCENCLEMCGLNL